MSLYIWNQNQNWKVHFDRLYDVSMFYKGICFTYEKSEKQSEGKSLISQSPRFKTTLITICRANNIADGKVWENQVDI